jgi:hypothetical protein
VHLQLSCKIKAPFVDPCSERERAAGLPVALAQTFLPLSCGVSRSRGCCAGGHKPGRGDSCLTMEHISLLR